jgi:hypothetical protein
MRLPHVGFNFMPFSLPFLVSTVSMGFLYDTQLTPWFVQTTTTTSYGLCGIHPTAALVVDTFCHHY